MSAVLEVREPSARYLAEPELIRQFELLATSPGGVARLRELILELAVQGKLVSQEPSDESIDQLLLQVQSSKLSAQRNKTSMPASEEEVPFQLPQGWRLVRIADVAILENGDRGSNYPSRDKFVESGIAFINAGHLSDRRVDYGDMNYITPQNFESLRSGKVQIGDILYCLRGSLGKFALVETPEPGAIASSLVIIRLLDRRFTPFFLRYLESPLASSLIKRFDNGTAQPNLGAGDLARFVFPVPPVCEQARIVTRVDELMRLCDTLEDKGRLEAEQHARLLGTLLGTLTDSSTPEELAANWQRVTDHFDLLLDRPEAVDALEQAILQLAVRGLLVPQDQSDEPASVLLERIRADKERRIATGKIRRDKPLSPLPDDDEAFALSTGWQWARMGDVVLASEAGWSPTCHATARRQGKWGVLKVSAVSWGTFDANANKELPDDLVARPEYEVMPGDFLLSRANTEELVARSVVVYETPPQLMLSDKIIRLDVSSYVDRAFLSLANNAEHSRAFYVAHASGTSSSMKNVSREVVLSLPVALPPLAEQARIVARVTDLRRLCADLRQRLYASQTTRSRLADALVDSATA